MRLPKIFTKISKKAKKQLDKGGCVWYYKRALPAGGAKRCHRAEKIVEKAKKVLDKENVVW